MTTKQKIDFDIGDIILDTATKDIGILVYRSELFDEFSDFTREKEIFVWDIYWNIPDPSPWPYDTNFHKYSETGLEFLIQSGIFIHYKCN